LQSKIQQSLARDLHLVSLGATWSDWQRNSSCQRRNDYGLSPVRTPCLDNERALWMIALAGNFYIFAPRITASLAAVLLAVRNIAAAWDVRALLVSLVYHGNSSDRYCSGFLIP